MAITNDLTVASEQGVIDNDTAHLINKVAEEFYSNPENCRKYAAWHLETYGCLPEPGGIDDVRKR